MRTPLVVAVTLASVGLVAPLVASDAADDAGTLYDASNSPASPTAIAFGSYQGALTSYDQDWFGAASTAGGPACFELDASGNGPATVTLGERGSGFDHQVTTALSTAASVPTKLFLAQSGASLAYAGFQRAAVQNGNPVDYAFTLAAAQPAAGGSSGTPTPGGLLASPAPLPGPCVSGELSPTSGVGHTTDLYTFAGTAGQQVVYSLGATSQLVTAQLIAPDGSSVGPSIATNGIALVTLPTTGTYTMSASASGSSVVDYLLALVGQGPPCTPYCTAN